MQINPIENYNQQTKNTCSFGSVRCNSKMLPLFQTPGDADNFMRYLNEMARIPVDLRYFINTKNMTPKAIKVLEKFYEKIGELQVQDFSIDFTYDSAFNVNRSAGYNSDKYPVYSFLAPYMDSENNIVTKLETMMIKNPQSYGNFSFPRTHNREVRAGYSKSGRVYADAHHVIFNKVAEIIKQRVINIADNCIEMPTKKRDTLPVASVVCTLDDINKYLAEHVNEIDDGEIFNTPITKDGESLLIALVHVLPDNENTDSYIKLVNNMSKMPKINYNQKDVMNIPAIAHVLNSQNKILFAAFTNSKDLRYEPSLEFEFKNIRDPKFKEMVLNAPIFENNYNMEFKTIFGQPNPVYKK